jgi:hypothetical protein
VHKAIVAVVIADVEVERAWDFDRRSFGTMPSHLRLLTEWLTEHEVEEVVMDRRRSTGARRGTPWNATGNRRSGHAWIPGPQPAHCISRRRSPIRDAPAESEISPMRSVGQAVGGA